MKPSEQGLLTCKSLIAKPRVRLFGFSRETEQLVARHPGTAESQKTDVHLIQELSKGTTKPQFSEETSWELRSVW